MSDEECWFCHRTRKELIKDDVASIVDEAIEEKHPVLMKIKSAKWVNMPSVCCVCLYLINEILVDSNVVFEDELRGINLV